MKRLPERRWLPQRCSPLLRRLGWSGVVVAGLGGGVLFGLWFWSDRLIGRVYEQVRPLLERQIGRVMGHPLELGPYRGLGPEGLQLGPSRFLPGPKDRSTASARAVSVGLDPWASWRQRALVLAIGFRGARAELRRNEQGQIWVLGSLPPGDEPPRLDLRFRVLDPALVRLWGVGGGSEPLALEATARVGVRVHRSELDLRARLEAPGRTGFALVQAAGQWKQKRWRAEIQPRRFPVAPLRSLLPLRGQLDGEAQGRVALQLEGDRIDCSGGLELRGLRWRPRPGADALSSPRLPLRCDDRQLTLAGSRWRYGDWQGGLSARAGFDRSFSLALRARPPAGSALAPLPLEARLAGAWAQGAVRNLRIEGSRGKARLLASGSLGRELDLRGRWSLDPGELPRAADLPEWLRQEPLSGTLSAEGRLTAPRLQVRTGQSRQPLVGPWRATLAWSDGLLRLESFRAEHLWATAELPLALRPGRGLVPGPLRSRLRIASFPLERLEPVLGTAMRGRLDADGRVDGPLASLRPDLNLTVQAPGAGPLLLQETWSGSLRPQPGGGGLLQLRSRGIAPEGRIEARLDRGWLPVSLELRRQDGLLRLAGSPAEYRWNARRFPLTGLALLLGPNQRLQPLRGDLSGEGTLGLQPLAFDSRVELDRPQFLGVGGRRIEARVTYRDRRYELRGTVEPLTAGRIEVEAGGRWQGPIEAEFRARQLNTVLLRELAQAVPRWRGAADDPGGRATDLGLLAISPPLGDLIAQLRALAEARLLVEQRRQQLARSSRADRLARLQFGIDADLRVRGPDLRRARAELEATGHVWSSQLGVDRALAEQPFEVRLEGPLGLGSGSFRLSGLSLALFGLVAPLPPSLSGRLALEGRYRLGGGPPRVEAELDLQDAELADRPLRLERGRIEVTDGALDLDLALRAEGASSSVDLAGTIPIDGRDGGLELRLASRDDGLHFLAALAGRAFQWKRGSADLQLLVRGSLREPIANGFVRLSDGECLFIGQTVRDLQATVLFDFEQLLLTDLSGRVGRGGQIRGEGKIGLLRPLTAEPTLRVDLQEVPFSVPRLTAVGNGQLLLGGSVTAPRLGGEVAISRGSINAQPGAVAKAEPASDRPAEPTEVNALLESRWDFSEPLVLLGPEVPSTTAESLGEAIPRVPWLRFQDLRVSLGPDLRVEMPNVAQFSTGGSLRISGRLDPSLQVSGVVRLLKGRLSLFTTTFSLDPDAPNVAVFTPSLGLVPYLDIALRTRISDSLALVGPSQFGGAPVGGPGASSMAEIEGQGGFSSFNQLQLILVTVSVSGPADRIAENLELRSSPPLPQERLVALIGGNSLAGLTGGSAGTALATVVGQSLLSPLLASFTDLFGQRVSLALYPTYVNPTLRSDRELNSRKVAPQLVLGTEVGFDLTERFNASVLAAPNRSDVPPQFTFTYKASENFNLQGSVDTQGSWQSQMQVFFRF